MRHSEEDVAQWLEDTLIHWHENQALYLVGERMDSRLKEGGDRPQAHSGSNPVEGLRQDLGDALLNAAQAVMEEKLDRKLVNDLLEIVGALEAIIVMARMQEVSDE